jgi:hypothetical protein
MVRMLKASLFSILLGAACSAAHADADQLVGPQPPPGTAIAIGIAPAKIRAPYDVQVLRENGDSLPTYAARDRFYVQGNAGERYIVKVTNPTAHRVEAVVTVDGLDVIDGEDGDLHKRGYVVPPYGEVRVEGFRTSQADVATFRFSSVNDSYAGRKGKARNVGVIAVAIFEEQHNEQQVIVGGEYGGGTYGGYRKPYDYTDDLADKDVRSAPRKYDAKKEKRSEDESADVRPMNKGRVESSRRVAKAPEPPRDAPQPAPTTTAPTGGRFGGGGQVGRPMPKQAPRIDRGGDDEVGEMGPPPPVAQRNNRPGLGTEYGESRYSAATFTRFVRNAERPIAIAELRYNNAAGLAALGINAEPLPDQGEIMTRETADPFPGDRRFSTAP